MSHENVVILEWKEVADLQAEGDSDPGGLRVQKGKGGIVVSPASPESDSVESESESRAEAKIKIGWFDLAVNSGVWLEASK